MREIIGGGSGDVCIFIRFSIGYEEWFVVSRVELVILEGDFRFFSGFIF